MICRKTRIHPHKDGKPAKQAYQTRTHFQHTTPARPTMVRALGFGSIALLAPLSRPVRLLALRGREQRLHKVLFLTLARVLPLGFIVDRAGVAREDDDEGREREEGERVDGKRVQNRPQNQAVDEIVISYEDDEKGGVRTEDHYDGHYTERGMSGSGMESKSTDGHAHQGGGCSGTISFVFGSRRPQSYRHQRCRGVAGREGVRRGGACRSRYFGTFQRIMQVLHAAQVESEKRTRRKQRARGSG